MKNQGLLIIVFMLFNFSCDRQEELPFTRDANGVITSMPYLWKTSLSTRGNLIDGSVATDISYEGNVLLPSQDGRTIQLTMLATGTGKILWRWDDLYDLDKDFDIYQVYQYNQYLAFQQGPRFYTIDLSTGATLLKEQRQYQAARMAGIGENYFIAGNFVLNDAGNYVGNIYTGSISQSNDTLVISPAYNLEYVDANNIAGIVGSAIPFEDEDGDILIIYDYSDPLPEWKANTYIGLYNYSEQKSIYDKKPLALGINSYGSGTPVIYKNKAYFASGRSIVCADLYSGEILWRKGFSEGFTFSGFIIVNDKLIANCEDTWLYALDPETGRELWKEKSSGTSSKMACLNGVVYFKGGGDGLLHAVEIETGKHLWKIHSPDLEVNSGAWFMPRVSVLPPAEQGEKGKVVVSSYLSAFCYEAAR